MGNHTRIINFRYFVIFVAADEPDGGLLTCEVARHAGHVAADEPDGGREALRPQDVRHQVHVVAPLGAAVRRAVEPPGGAQRQVQHLQEIQENTI